MSKFCTYCGNEVNDNAVVCVKCGCQIPRVQHVLHDTTEEKSVAHVSIVFGILGIVFAWLFALVGHILSIIGIVRGVKEYKDTARISGLIFSIVGEVCSVFSSIIGAITMAYFF